MCGATGSQAAGVVPDRGAAGEGEAGRAPARTGRPPCLPRAPYPCRRGGVRQDGAGSRGVDRRGALRLEPQGARRAVPAARQGEKPRARDHGTKGRRMKETGLARYRPKHFQWRAEGRVGVLTLDRPEKKNPLTFESYGELRDLFHALSDAHDVRAAVVTGAGGNFCSGGDVHEIIGPLTKTSGPESLEFTGMTGDLVKAMRHCPQPIIAAVD